MVEESRNRDLGRHFDSPTEEACQQARVMRIREDFMKWNYWIRQTHRWLGVAFTVTVIANIVVMTAGQGEMPAPWITYSPLLPLALLWLSGMYLFVLPYVARRSTRQAVH